MFGINARRKWEREWKQKCKESQIQNELDKKESIELDEIFKKENSPKYKPKETFGVWIIMKPGYFTSSSIWGSSMNYNRRNKYQCLNSFSGKTEHWNESDITLVKETLDEVLLRK